MVLGALKLFASPHAWANILDNAGESSAECLDRQLRQAQDRAKYASVSGIRDGLRLGISVSNCFSLSK